MRIVSDITYSEDLKLDERLGFALGWALESLRDTIVAEMQDGDEENNVSPFLTKEQCHDALTKLIDG